MLDIVEHRPDSKRLSDSGKSVCNLVGELFDENLDMVKDQKLFTD
jgi:TnpA family transposase